MRLRPIVVIRARRVSRILWWIGTFASPVHSTAVETSVARSVRGVEWFGSRGGRGQGIPRLSEVTSIGVGVGIEIELGKRSVVAVLIGEIATFRSWVSVAKSRFEFYQDSPEVEQRGVRCGVGKDQRFHVKR
jgi:hypothetical protein